MSTKLLSSGKVTVKGACGIICQRLQSRRWNVFCFLSSPCVFSTWPSFVVSLLFLLFIICLCDKAYYFSSLRSAMSSGGEDRVHYEDNVSSCAFEIYANYVRNNIGTRNIKQIKKCDVWFLLRGLKVNYLCYIKRTRHDDILYREQIHGSRRRLDLLDSVIGFTRNINF